MPHEDLTAELPMSLVHPIAQLLRVKQELAQGSSGESVQNQGGWPRGPSRNSCTKGLSGVEFPA